MQRRYYTIIAASTAAIAITIGLAANPRMRNSGTGDAPLPTISVTGSGTAISAPDLAILRIGIEETAPDAARAMAAARQAMAGIYNGLQDLGIPRRATTTTRISLSPDRTPDGIRGYRASNMVTIEITDLDGVGPLIDRLVEAGGNRIDGLSFTVSDEAGLLEDARRAAALDALLSARQYAAGMGYEVTGLISSSQPRSDEPRPYRAMSRNQVSTRIQPGDVEVSARIEATYTLSETSPIDTIPDRQDTP